MAQLLSCVLFLMLLLFTPLPLHSPILHNQITTILMMFRIDRGDIKLFFDTGAIWLQPCYPAAISIMQYLYGD